MITVNQITPEKLIDNKNRLDAFLQEELAPTISESSWMKWEGITQRFKLDTFKTLSDTDLTTLQWNEEHVDVIVKETIQKVNQYLTYDKVLITILPALPFSFFKNQPQSLWLNGFTNGPGTILLAIPSKPDIDYFQYLLAHELHHATPENPIYQLNLETFTLEEWYKMEGAAEYFSLSLYPDKRWWRDNLPVEVEESYWEACKEHLKVADDQIKGPLCFGNPKEGIPIFAGYSFALKLISNYVSTNKIEDIKELFAVEPAMFIENYKRDLLNR